MIYMHRYNVSVKAYTQCHKGHRFTYLYITHKRHSYDDLDQLLQYLSPVSYEHQPGSGCSINFRLHVVLQPLVLLGPLPEHMLSTHEHKMDWSISNPIPGYKCICMNI